MNNIPDLIKKSLNYYDKQKKKYEKYILNTKIKIMANEIIIYNDDGSIMLQTDFEVLGIFDFQTKVWIWSWLLPGLNLEQIELSKQLLDYGLKLEPRSNNKDHYYIKTQLTNSRFLIENDIELDINISLASYLLKDNYLFICPFKLYFNKEKTRYQTIYYIIKNI